MNNINKNSSKITNKDVNVISDDLIDGIPLKKIWESENLFLFQPITSFRKKEKIDFRSPCSRASARKNSRKLELRCPGPAGPELKLKLKYATQI